MHQQTPHATKRNVCSFTTVCVPNYMKTGQPMTKKAQTMTQKFNTNWLRTAIAKTFSSTQDISTQGGKFSKKTSSGLWTLTLCDEMTKSSTTY